MSRRLGLYRSANGWLYAARSFEDVARLAEDSDAHGGWTRLNPDTPVTLRTTAGGTTTQLASVVTGTAGLTRGLVFAPAEA